MKWFKKIFKRWIRIRIWNDLKMTEGNLKDEMTKRWND